MFLRNIFPVFLLLSFPDTIPFNVLDFIVLLFALYFILSSSFFLVINSFKSSSYELYYILCLLIIGLFVEDGAMLKFRGI